MHYLLLLALLAAGVASATTHYCVCVPAIPTSNNDKSSSTCHAIYTQKQIHVVHVTYRPATLIGDGRWCALIVHGELCIQVLRLVLDDEEGAAGHSDDGEAGASGRGGGAPLDAARGAAGPAGHRAHARQRVPRAGRRPQQQRYRRRGRGRRRRPPHPRRVRRRPLGVVAGAGVGGSDLRTYSTS